MTQTKDEKKNQILLSVIIPVYQAEQYLEKCIDSVLAQRLPLELMQTDCEAEIILVDDGSKDSSAQICDGYASIYSGRDSSQDDGSLTQERPSDVPWIVRSIHQKNQGNATARNAGLQQARGEFIMFVDADDYLPNRNAVKKMVEQAYQNHADIVAGNYVREMDGKIVSANRHGFTEETKEQDLAYRFDAFFSGGSMAYLWGKIYRRSFLADNHLKLTQLSYAEDKLFNMECYVWQPKYAYVEEDVYCYRYNENSISHEYKADFFETWMSLGNTFDEYIRKHHKEALGDDMVAFCLFFAVFFQAKQEYEHSGKKVSVVKQTIRRYATQPLAAACFSKLARGRYVRETGSISWRIMIQGFCAALKLRLYGLLALGIKILIDGKVDQRLSSTGQAKT